MVGFAGCPVLFGVLYESGGGYAVPFFAAAAGSLLGMAVLAAFGSTRR